MYIVYKYAVDSYSYIVSYSSTYWSLLILVFLMCTSRALTLFFEATFCMSWLFCSFHESWIFVTNCFLVCEVRLLFQEPSTNPNGKGFSLSLVGGNSNIFWNFHPYFLGEDEAILTCIFFKWVGEKPPTSSLFLEPLLSTDRNRYLLDLRRKLSLPEDQVGSKYLDPGRTCSLGKGAKNGNMISYYPYYYLSNVSNSNILFTVCKHA